MGNILAKSDKFKVEYISIVDTDTLCDVESVRWKALVAVAARLGNTRLIDNMIIDLNKP